MASYHHVKKALANKIHQPRQKTKSWKHTLAANSWPWPDHQNESEDADSEGSGEMRRVRFFREYSEEGTDDAGSISETASYRNYYEEMVNDRPPSSTNVSTWEYGIHWTRRAYSDATRSSYRESFGTRGENLSFLNKARARAYGYQVTSPIHEEEQPSLPALNTRTVVEPIIKSTTPAPSQSRITLSSKEIIPASTRPAGVENVPKNLEHIHHPSTSTKNRIIRGNSQRAPIDINQDDYIPIVEADHLSNHPPPHDSSRKVPQAPREVKKTVRFTLGDTSPVSHRKMTRGEKFIWQPSNNLLSPYNDATKRQAIYIPNDILHRLNRQKYARDTH